MYPSELPLLRIASHKTQNPPLLRRVGGKIDLLYPHAGDRVQQHMVRDVEQIPIISQHTRRSKFSQTARAVSIANRHGFQMKHCDLEHHSAQGYNSEPW